MSERPTKRPFPTTKWSLIWNAGDELTEDRRAAIDELLMRYWPALVAHLVVRKRMESHDAEDLVQGFIAAKMLERNLLGSASKERGRFRSFLLKSLDNYVANEMEKRSARKRVADRAVAVDPQEVAIPDQSCGRAEDIFDIEWARQILITVAERMKAETKSNQRDDIWGVFESRILMPTIEGRSAVDYQALVDKFGFRSPSQAANALITGKRMYMRILRSVVSEYASDEEDAEAEIRDLERVLSRQ